MTDKSSPGPELVELLLSSGLDIESAENLGEMLEGAYEMKPRMRGGLSGDPSSLQRRPTLI